jgi:diguanylate cyclase (GGDEF)-like protein
MDTYKFTGYSLVLFIIFKSILTISRFISFQFETPALKMSALSSVNVMTLVSLIFAIWINFAIYFLYYDLLHHDVKEMSLRDHLTKLPNRRSIMNKIDEMYQLHSRGKMDFALAMFDLDDFKKVNDQYGHGIGDEVLVDFADFLKEEMRAIDFIGRYGGEEYILILLAENLEEARKILDRIMSRLSKNTLSSKEIHITFSGGVVWVGKDTRDMDSSVIISLADKRLYEAKTQGKNRMVYPGEGVENAKTE